ncbi:MAG: hypothetical protein ACRDBG_01380 [Waterburya sp.]
MVKTAIIIGGYARAGKSTAMTYLAQSISTFGMSSKLAEHVKLLIPYLAQYDFTTDDTKGLSFPPSTAYITTVQIDRTLEKLGFNLDYWQLFEIYKDYHQRFVGKYELTLRDICIAVAESTRKILPNIYVDLVLGSLGEVELLAIETIGGKECDYLYQRLKTLRYTVVGQNIRRKTELAGVDIRELINDTQCDKLLFDVHNDYHVSLLEDYLNSVLGSVRDK